MRQGAILSAGFLVIGFLVIGFLAVTPAAARDAPWSHMTSPSPGPARALGSPSGGCLAGASALPFDGTGYQVIRISRNRYWGHGALLDYVQTLGRQASAAGLATLYIGDLSQPRGGPMAWGHASHQTGLDVDILFDLTPKTKQPPAARETIAMASLLVPDAESLDPTRWTRQHRELLSLAASFEQVERIFVNGAIKRQLCLEIPQGPARAWLHKLRPWRGHDAHFHVRLNCPPTDEECVAGRPIPPGDGCDEALARLRASPESTVRALLPRPVQPPGCRALLRAVFPAKTR